MRWQRSAYLVSHQRARDVSHWKKSERNQVQSEGTSRQNPMNHRACYSKEHDVLKGKPNKAPSALTFEKIRISCSFRDHDLQYGKAHHLTDSLHEHLSPMNRQAAHGTWFKYNASECRTFWEVRALKVRTSNCNQTAVVDVRAHIATSDEIIKFRTKFFCNHGEHYCW